MTDHLTRQFSIPTAQREGRIGDVPLRRWLDRVVRGWQRHRMAAALHELDDRMLADIGLLRADIPDVVRGFDTRELQMTPVFQPVRDIPAPDAIYRMAA